VRRHLAAAGGDVVALVGYWHRRYAPSTAVTYAATLRRIIPADLDATLEVALRALRKAAPICALRRAQAVTPSLMLKVTNAKEAARWTAILLYVSATRHGDLAAVSFGVWEGPTPEMAILQLQFAPHKSDVFGQRNISKWVVWPKVLLRHLRSLAPYAATLKFMHKMGAELTVHSLRRGAATGLASAGYAMEEILLLTGHTPSADPNLAVRRYIDAHPAQPEAKKCLEMSGVLSGPLWTSLGF